ncbi:hypothetical protein IW152_001353 [Coemansia sp. BCRC 34962]|nr:hypothetical protein IW152_001353 [Coemansia sp. BCRC 34962]
MSANARNAVIQASIPSLEHYNGAQLWGTRPSTTIGTRILKSLARAKAAIIHDSPPAYSRGAWAIINDVPFPPPPPYAGSSRHPPTYNEALEIGVVASPLRAEQRMRCRCQQHMSLHVSTVCSVAINRTSDEDMEATTSGHNFCTAHLVTLPGDERAKDELLPKYADIEDVAPVSLVVRQWRLGQAAFEKPPLHPRGFTNYRRHASHH